MPITTPDWQQIAIYAVGAALVLALLQRIPFVGRLVRFALSLSLLAVCFYILLQQAPFDPGLSRITRSLGLDRQEIVGDEVRIRMAPDGHFWANVSLNGTERRMLIDSGATMTTLSEETAAAAGVAAGTGMLPVVLRTANGMVQARTGTVETLAIGPIRARDLRIVVAPSLGTDIIGMNFLTDLASWRVEGRTLILVPQSADGGLSAAEPADGRRP